MGRLSFVFRLLASASMCIDLLLCSQLVQAQQLVPPPVVSTPASDHPVPAPPSVFDPKTGAIIDSRWASGVPIGGIGVGKIELLTDGSFGDFTNNHNWDRPYGWAKGAFAAVWEHVRGQPTVTRMLRGASADEYGGVTNVAHTRMQGWFPRGEVAFSDAALPVKVHLSAFSPLVPHDIKDSSLPVACFAYTLTNTSMHTVAASILLAWPNLLGWGGRAKGPFLKIPVIYNNSIGNAQHPLNAGDLSGLSFTTTQNYTDQQENTVGAYYLGVHTDPSVHVSLCPSWDANAPIPGFWTAFAQSGTLKPITETGSEAPAGAVCAQTVLSPGRSKTIQFYLVWAMPHMLMVDPTGTYGLDKVGSATDTQLMFDQNNTTRWDTARGQKAGDTLEINLGASQTPASISMSCGLTDYPHGLTIQSSTDDHAWTTVATIGSKTAGTMDTAGNGVLTIPLVVKPARYLRFVCLGSDDVYWWSIYDLRVNVQGGTVPLSSVNFRAAAYLMSPEPKISDAGYFWQNNFHSAPEIASYVDKNEVRLYDGTIAWQELVRRSNLPFWLQLKLINCAFPIVTNTILTRDGRFAIQESPVTMAGAVGTMDQRMAAHTFYTAFFPELDRAGLELFAHCQQPNGSITHMDGNLYSVIGSPNVLYGITGWPDLSCGWVLQVAQEYRWTGDRAFLKRLMPGVNHAMEWLMLDGANDDSIPTGGSTYDYEHAPAGAFIYTASCYLGALQAAISLANASGMTDQADAYKKQLATVQASVMRDLWTGVYFRKWKVPSTGQANNNSFIANMAGDWLARLSGLPRTLPPAIIHQSVGQTIARHMKPFWPIPPMEVTPDGTMPSGAAYVLQDEPYLGCEAIYENYVDDGLDMLNRIYYCVWPLNRDPWNESLVYWSPDGHRFGFPYYMTSPTSWNVLYALSGASVDLPDQTLTISPRLTSKMEVLHMPLFFPRFWAWLDYTPKSDRMSLRILRVFPSDPTDHGQLYTMPGPQSMPSVTPPLITTITANGDSRLIHLTHPFAVRAGATLDLSPYLPQLKLPVRSDEVTSAFPPS